MTMTTAPPGAQPGLVPVGQLPQKTLGSTNRFYNFLVYGLHGVGKTYLASTAPRPVYLLDCDQGTLSLASADEVYYERVSKLAELQNRVLYLQDSFKANPNFVKTIFFDNLTEMQSLIMYDLTKGKLAQQKDWGDVLNIMTGVIRDIRDLPCHKVFIAQEKTKEGKTFPAMSGSIVEKVPEYFDEVGHYTIATMMEPVGNGVRERKATVIRAIEFTASPTCVTKDRSDCLSEYEDPDLTAIIDKIKKAHTVQKANK